MLTSTNEKLKRLRKLVHSANFRSTERAFVIEGPNAVEAMLRSDFNVEALFFSADLKQNHMLLLSQAYERGLAVFEVAPGTLESSLDLTNAQPLVAIAPIPDSKPLDLNGASPLLILDELRDPGNAGTIIRSAHATGVHSIVFLPGSVDPYNPKVVRSSAGSLFFTKCHTNLDRSECFSRLRELNTPTYFALASQDIQSDNTHVYTELDLASKVAMVIGNEAHGVSNETKALCDGGITIPTLDSLESLNASMAATVLLFESWRQRGLH